MRRKPSWGTATSARPAHPTPRGQCPAIEPSSWASAAHDQLAANLGHLADEHIDRHRSPVHFAIVGRFAVEREGPGVLCRGGQKGLQECRIDIGTVVVAGERPEMSGQRAAGPWTLLLEADGCRPSAPLPGAQQQVAAGRRQEDGAVPPIRPAAVGALRDRKKVCTNSPIPVRVQAPGNMLRRSMIGGMAREITFRSSLTEAGTIGRTLNSERFPSSSATILRS